MFSFYLHMMTTIYYSFFVNFEISFIQGVYREITLTLPSNRIVQHSALSITPLLLLLIVAFTFFR